MEAPNLPTFLQFRNAKNVLSLQKIMGGHETGETGAKLGAVPLPRPGLRSSEMSFL